MKTEAVHIDTIKAGDTIFHQGAVRTLTENYIKHDRFIGTTIWGDSYNSGHKPVTKVISF